MSVRIHALALLATGGLVTTALGAGAGASAAGPAAAGADRPAAIAARAGGGWRTVSSGTVDALSEITLARTSDGVLHAVYDQDVGTVDEYEHAAISTSGTVIARSKPVGTWSALIHNPKLMRSPSGGLRLVFSGLQDGNSANFFSHGYAFDTISDASGAAWTLQPHALTRFSAAYSGYGVAGVTLSNGTPVTAATLNSDTYYRVGAIETTDANTVTTSPPDGASYAGAGNYYWHTQLVNSGDTVWMMTYVDGTSEATDGIFAQQIYPTVGTPLKAPGSSVGSDSLNPDQTVAAVARPGGGVMVAYKSGYPTANAISVWQIGGAVKKVKASEVLQVALDAGPSGRMWLAWVDSSDQVHATRSAPTGLSFGPVQDLGKPTSTSDLWRIAVDASLDQGTVLVNDTLAQRVSLRTVKPGLLLATSGSLRAHRQGAVKVRVTDAGIAVKGAKVKGGGDSCTTKAKGTCSLTVTPTKAGKITFVATRGGYGSGKDTVKVRS